MPANLPHHNNHLCRLLVDQPLVLFPSPPTFDRPPPSPLARSILFDRPIPGLIDLSTRSSLLSFPLSTSPLQVHNSRPQYSCPITHSRQYALFDRSCRLRCGCWGIASCHATGSHCHHHTIQWSCSSRLHSCFLGKLWYCGEEHQHRCSYAGEEAASGHPASRVRHLFYSHRIRALLT